MSEINLQPDVTLEQLVSDQFTLGGLPKDWNNSLDYKSGQGPSDEYKEKNSQLFNLKKKSADLSSSLENFIKNENCADNPADVKTLDHEVGFSTTPQGIFRKQLKAIASDIGKKDIKNKTEKQIQEEIEVLKEIKKTIDSLNESSKKAECNDSIDDILQIERLNASYEEHMKGSSAISVLPAKGCFRRVDRTKK